MIRNGLLIAVGTCVAVGALAWASLRNRVSDTNVSAVDDVSRLKSELAKLQGDQSQLRSVVGAAIQNAQIREALGDRGNESHDPIAEKGTASDDTVVPQYVDPVTEMPQPEEQQARRIARIEEVVRSEHPDPDWAPVAIRTLEDTYGRLALPGFKYAAHCGQTLCRVNFTLETGSNGNTQMNALMGRMPWEGQAVVSVSGDGVGVSYFARPGHDLPGGDDIAMN